MRFLIPGFIAPAMAAALTGCGGDSQKKPPVGLPTQQIGVLDAVDSLQTASRRSEGERICDEIFTPRLARSVGAGARKGCAREVKVSLFPPRASLAVGRDIRFSGDRAVASVMDQNGKVSKLLFVKQTERWRIDTIKPVRRPGR